MIPEWPWLLHLVAYMGQLIFFVAVWHLVKFINDSLETRFPFETSVRKRVSLQLLLSILFITPIYLVMYYLARDRLPPFANEQFIAIGSMLLFVMILLLNSGFYFIHFFRRWQKSVEEKAALQIVAAELQREKARMQYHHLKNQVNPHFLFNTFTSIDGLVHSDPQLASQFIRHLTKVYRYILENRENEVVRIEKELDFLRHYISLLEIRYMNAIRFEVALSDRAMERGIVTVTLQMLLDNAIKHNEVSVQKPLTIRIVSDNEFVMVQNNKQLRKQIEHSNRHGLSQLSQLYSYLSPQAVQILDTTDEFCVKIPLL